MRSFTSILSAVLLVLAAQVAAQGSPRGLSNAAGSVVARDGNDCPPGQQYDGNSCHPAKPKPSGGYSKKRSVPRGCTVAGHTRCEVGKGSLGWECIDTSNTLDACGSCDNDCSAIPYVGSVSCIKGQCQVSSCRKGFELEYLNGKPTCMPTTKQGYMIIEADMKLMN
ncbi:hypothetical protein BDV93DRAFT_57852 [Ceratobasidium sp. AG-I]|nr:hypothetical protein BDV93DRAFT_57852 [Ceratobasidium sp. AG-I]